MAVAFVAAVEGGAGTAPLTLSSVDVEAGTGTNMCIVVAVAYIDATGDKVASVAFQAAGGDEAFTKVGSANGGNSNVELWVLANPSQETADVMITGAIATKIRAGAMTFEFSNQTEVFLASSVTEVSGTDTSCLQDVVSLVSEMSVNAIGVTRSGPPGVTGEQTEAFNGAQTGLGDDVRCAAQYKASGGDKESMDWTIAASSDFACVGVSLIQFGLGATNTNYRATRRYQSRYRLTAHKVRN